MNLACSQAPFLAHAGQGTLDPDVLQQWLAQDRLYAQNYINFAGALLSKIRLPVQVNAQSTEKKAIRLVSFALQNVIRELQFFEDTAAKHQIDLTPRWAMDGDRTELRNSGPSPWTRAYADMMLSATSPSASVLEGLTLLYGTELCYLTAWTYAKNIAAQQAVSSSSSSQSPTFTALKEEFIPNWTCDEFVAFVDDCRSVMDEVASQSAEQDKEKAVEVYRQVLWLEEQFWPAC